MKKLDPTLKGIIDSETGKYKFSKEDIDENKRLIKIMQKQIHESLISKFGKITSTEQKDYKKPLIKDQITFYNWFNGPTINSKNFQSDGNIFTYIQTGVNSNGYNDKEIKRHFVFSFVINGKAKYKYWRRWEEMDIIKRHFLADSLEDLLREVKFFINVQLDSLINNANKNINREYKH